jgi:integrase
VARPRTPIGTFGEISETTPEGRARALTRFRDYDGRLRRVMATAPTPRAAERRLKELLAERAEQSVGQGELSPSSSFRQLVDVWLADLDLKDKIAPSTRALYERNMEKLVMPSFEQFALREISVRKVDQFLKTLARTRSYSMAKQARTVLSLALGLAVRYDAIRQNPVRDTARLRKPPTQAMSLTVEQVEQIRRAVRGWRRDPGVPGPPPDGQLEQIIEVMLGTFARIGDVFAIRRCDVDVTTSPATVRLCGKIVSPAGKPTPSPASSKTMKSTRTVSVPSFAAEVLRRGCSISGEARSIGELEAKQSLCVTLTQLLPALYIQRRGFDEFTRAALAAEASLHAAVGVVVAEHDAVGAEYGDRGGEHAVAEHAAGGDVEVAGEVVDHPPFESGVAFAE